MLAHFILTALVGLIVLVLGGVWLARTPPGLKHRLIKFGSTTLALILLLEALIGAIKWGFSFF